MLKALVLKELRETAGLAALGVLACAYALAALTGMQLLSWQPNPIYEVHVPFVDDKVLGFLAAIGSLLAVGLGLKQSAWESWQGTYIFLLHRPASRRAMFGTKLAVGAGLLLLVTGGMVLLYALWAARPGHHPSPFLWSMTIGAWRVWLSLPLLYLGRVSQWHPAGAVVWLATGAVGRGGDPGAAGGHGAAVVAGPCDRAAVGCGVREQHRDVRRLA